ncbi:bifunctional serine/threonine-protein kinase/formylglycine-generating enzyme family protein [Sorangium sp. So ce1504]|uniref:bifunctional serine/threonine-protein kinase/formylglycine-generating enzyme family protein n=1 Tax=Sorangium sp. So ce1504 TaxID=3133337 RepID=UPI003F61EBEA
MDSLLRSSIGQYLITEEIGRGGMGVVYRAVHRSVGQLAAVKVLSSQLARDASQLRRFTNEARALSLVDHPGLVKIFDFGETPQGEPYILMEYLRGELLRSRLMRCKRLALPEVLRIGRQAASALAAVHKNGIVHRDLKPSNMMLVADDEASGGERLKLLDFGIARFTEDKADLTAPGSVLGTAMYMSPEQCVGQSPVDSRSDIYSLGVVLHELLAGEPPFTGEPVEVLRMHLFQDPRPLSEVAPEVPQEISSLIRRMLAKEPSRRPDIAQIAEAMRRDIAATPAVTPAAVVGSAAESTSAATPEAGYAGRTTVKKPAVRETTPHERGSRPGGTKVAEAAEVTPSEAAPSPGPGADNTPEQMEVRVERTETQEVTASSARPQGRGLVGLLAIPALLVTASYGLVRACSNGVGGGPAQAALTRRLPLKAALVASAPARPAPPERAPVSLSNMVRLPGGQFRMGSTLAEIDAECQRLGPECRRDLLEREQPVREVTVSPFYIDAYETTNAEFAAWLDVTSPALDIKEDPEHRIQRYVHERARGYLLVDLFPEYSGILLRPERRFVPRPGHENKPVIQVTWDAASLYCKARGKRLPTEAEWEFAARGATARRFPWGSDPPRCDGVAFGVYEKGLCERSPKGEQDVGTSLQDRTPEGVWDLGGNAAEWVQDQFLLPHYGSCGDCIDPVTEGPGVSREEDQRIRRGGSWPALDVMSRGVTRGRSKRIEGRSGLGFRCASR